MSNVVLLSGGIDSTTVLAMLVKEHGSKGVSFVCADFGTKQSYMEKSVAELIAVKRYGILGEHLNLKWIGSPTSNHVVPGRNAVLISAAASIAKTIGSTSVYIGCNADDAANFPDCSIEFLDGMQAAMKHGYGITLCYPLARKTKRQVVGMARELGVNLDETYSCYAGNHDHCGECLACKLRAAAIGES